MDEDLEIVVDHPGPPVRGLYPLDGRLGMSGNAENDRQRGEASGRQQPRHQREEQRARRALGVEWEVVEVVGGHRGKVEGTGPVGSARGRSRPTSGAS